MKTIYLFLIALGFCRISTVHAQCNIDSFLIRNFEFNGSIYEIILETRNWQDAATCAVSRGGKLLEINSQAEQDAVFMEINNVFFDHSNTVAPDGGGASYMWLGGNDASSEGNWVWNGDNDSQSSPFWIGNSNGSPVNGSYENWGNEPDNWNNQDGLAIAVTDWPLGQSGQWNDVFLSNELYFIVEHPPVSLGIAEEINTGFALWPNPAKQQITISFGENDGTFRIADLSGKTFLRGETTSGVSVVELSAFASGTYLVYAGQEIIKLVIE